MMDSETLYEVYCLKWAEDYIKLNKCDMTPQELVDYCNENENGYHGSSFCCYDEFVKNELQDEKIRDELMNRLFGDIF